jgi:transposase InsO family protein
VLTDNGIQFTFPPRYADGPTATYITPMFDMRCHEHGIEHRRTKIQHPWTNGQVERMNRTIKDATGKRYHDESHRQLDAQLHDFINAYNKIIGGGSKPSRASRPSNTSAKYGYKNQNDVPLTQPIKCWD